MKRYWIRLKSINTSDGLVSVGVSCHMGIWFCSVLVWICHTRRLILEGSVYIVVTIFIL